jgi:CheY-like chemotaxis protein
VSISIFLVEDDVLSLAFYKQLLQRRPCHVRGFGSAEEALSAFEEEPRVELLITDQELPGMSGLELVKRIKRSNISASTTCILFSAHDDPGFVQAAHISGCSGYVAKPIDAATFADTVFQYLPAPREVEVTVPDKALRLRELRKDFVSRALSECQVLSQFDGSEVGLLRARAILHRMVGCGAAAGMPEISVEARILQDLFGCVPLSDVGVKHRLENVSNLLLASMVRQN